MTTPLWKKLNLKDQKQLAILNAPASFEAAIADLPAVQVHRDLNAPSEVTFLLAFVTERDEIEAIAAQLGKLAQGDIIVWLCYPKGTSKRYTCNFNRDTGWTAMGNAGFEGVRMVAIDEDWSAFRFRRVEYVKTMTRDPKRAITTQGKSGTRGATSKK